MRFSPEYERARELVAAGQVGRPGVIRTMRHALPQPGETLLTDLLAPDFAWLCATFGSVERVYAQARQEPDYALVILRFVSGAIAHVEGSRAHAGARYGFEIAGDGGLLEFDSAKVQPVVIRGVPESPVGEAGSAVDAEALAAGQAVARAAAESARTRRPVTLAKEGV